MSAYYVIGTNKKLENIDRLNAGFEAIPALELNRYIPSVKLTRKFYYVSDYLSQPLIYCKNINMSTVNFDNLDTNLNTLIKYLKAENKNLDQVDVYKFWCIFDKHKQDDDINEIYMEKIININNDIENNDFTFNTKYILKKEQ